MRWTPGGEGKEEDRVRLSAPLSDVGMAVEDMAMYYKPYIAAALPRDSLLQPRARFLFDARRSIADTRDPCFKLRKMTPPTLSSANSTTEKSVVMRAPKKVTPQLGGTQAVRLLFCSAPELSQVPQAF